MNQIETENDAALAEVYGQDLADNGVQAEGIQIDGRSVLGNLSFDNDTIQLVPGGWNENPVAVFFTLKSQFPNGVYPKPLSSELLVVVNGKLKKYQVRELNGDRDNRAQLAIGIAAFENRK